MKRPDSNAAVKLDLNNVVFQSNLFHLEKHDRHSALETLKKLMRLTWNQVYADQGLKWEKIASVAPPPGIAAIYSLRITQSRRATAYREGDFMRFLTIAPDHDATYGRR
jgi:hypothetical protein